MRAMQEEILSQYTKLLAIVERLERREDGYKDYDDFEYALFYFNNMVLDYVDAYERRNDEIERSRVELFDKFVKEEKTATATEKRIDKVLSMEIELLNDMKANKKLLEGRLRALVRVAEHNKSTFIREMAETKRQEVTQNFNIWETYTWTGLSEVATPDEENHS